MGATDDTAAAATFSSTLEPSIKKIYCLRMSGSSMCGKMCVCVCVCVCEREREREREREGERERGREMEGRRERERDAGVECLGGGVGVGGKRTALGFG